MSVEESPPAPWGLTMHKGQRSHIPSFLNCCSWFPTINNEWNLRVRNYHSAWKAQSKFDGYCLSTVNVFHPSSWLWTRRSQKWLMNYYLLASVAQDLGVAGKQKPPGAEGWEGWGYSRLGQLSAANHIKPWQNNGFCLRKHQANKIKIKSKPTEEAAAVHWRGNA